MVPSGVVVLDNFESTFQLGVSKMMIIDVLFHGILQFSLFSKDY